MSNQGWILLYRSIQDSELWNDVEPFDYRSAFIDLLLMANHKNGSAFDKVPVSRGQHLTSLRKLSAKWHWHRLKVKKFLEILERENMVTVQREKRYMIITICNYDKYQVSTTGRTSVRSSVRSDVRSSVLQTKNDIKECLNNEKEVKATPSSFGGIERQ